MINKIHSIILLTLITSISAYSGIEPVNTRLQGEDLSNVTTGTATDLDLSDNKYWMVESGMWANYFDIQSVQNKITFGIDEADLTYQSAEFSYRITFDVTYKVIEDGVLTTKNETNIQLDINYRPARGSTYKDRAVYNFTGGLDVKIDIRDISKETTIGSGTWVDVETPTPMAIPSSLYLESEIVTERYYIFDQMTIPSTAMTATVVGDELEVSWPYIEGAEEYELEWAWVNGYTGEVDGGGIPTILAASAVTYNFNYDATRVKVSGANTYNIPLIYGDGYIILRYRGVGRGGTNHQIPLEGSWSSEGTAAGSSGTVGNYPNYIAISAHESNGINYGAGMSFIEGGVKSVGVTYMDGVLKPRQSQAKLNSQDDIIVGSTIYDHYGRPAIGVMSTPVNQSTLGYVEELNMYDATTHYDKQHFDLDETLVCNDYEAASLMDSVNSKGAANYYSNSNTDKEGYNAYLATSEGYPFVQVQYSPDPTGRIKKVGGVGADHQLGDTDAGANDSHYTEYFYTNPDEDELWELFGNDAARPANYTKVITKDVHGQISVALIDGMGRTVATYLEGDEPTGLEAIEGNTTATNTTIDFMPYNMTSLGDGILMVQRPIMVSDPTEVYTFNYDFTGVTFSDCLPVDICFDCVYELEITIIPDQATACDITDGATPTPTVLSDADGIVSNTYTVGSITSFDIDCDTPLEFSTEFPGDETFNIQFGEIGTYYVVKKLKVSEAPIHYYWDQYIENNTCLLTYDDFLQTSLGNIDLTACDEFEPCEFNFLLEYGTETVWLAANPGETAQDYADLKAGYLADCGTLNSCDLIKPLLLLDMSPGGQYGSTTTTDNLSVYNSSTNDLGGAWDDVGVTYYNFDGSQSYVDADGDGVYDDSPKDLSISEFFVQWQDSWAESLIQFHPEICYYDFCVDNPLVADYEQDMLAIDNYTDACTAGLVNPCETIGYFTIAACTTNVEDPIFESGLYGSLSPSDTVAVGAIMVDLYDGNTIYDAAIILAGDDPGTTNFGSGCNGDKHWQIFRSLYLSKRFQVIEILKDDYASDNGCSDAPCVGNQDPSCDSSPFQDSSPRYFTWGGVMGYDLSNASTTDWSGYSDSTALEIDTLCFNMCDSLASEWMAQLDSCEYILPGIGADTVWAAGYATYDSVYFYLVEVCAGGCAGGCYQPTQYNSNVTSDTANHIFTSFEEVLVHFVGDDTTFCSNLLIQNPGSSSCDGSIVNYLDKCACDALLPTADAAAFEALYGFIPAEYDREKCLCEEYDGNSNNVIDTSSPDEQTSLDDDSLVTTSIYPCDGEGCLDCISLFKNAAGSYVYDFNAEYGVEYFEDPILFTAYVNQAEGTNYTYNQLLDLIQNCENAYNSGTTPFYNLLDQTTFDIRELLVKLDENDLTTSSLYDHLELPEYFYTGLYPCTDQTTASYLFVPVITSNTLDFYIAGQPCGGDTCNIELDIAGGLPTEFSTATEFYQNIISFDEVFMIANDVSGVQTNVFRINVTMDDLTGGTTSETIIVTSCYDVIEYQLAENKLNFTICDNDFTVEEGNPCMDNLIAEAELDAEAQYEAYLDEQYDLFVADYKETCIQVTNEAFDVTYKANRYHYTLLYYDLSGNLTKTVPPAGVDFLDVTEIASAKTYANSGGTAVYPAHTFQTTYKHNSINQVIEVNTPDGGQSKYWYDNIGRLVVSQNARQEDFRKGLMTDSPETGTLVPAYSYTKYDALGRVTEVGEIIHEDAMTNAISKDPTDLADWLDDIIGTTSGEAVVKNNITLIYYDDVYENEVTLEFGPLSGQHLRNRITATAVISGYVETTGGAWVYPDPDYINHYDYDVHGNVRSFLQEIDVLADYDNQYRRVDYEYDLISGNPNYIWYQKGKEDQYVHHYVYDKDNRLKEVFTSDDGQIWDRDVNYEYREDGYLARTELGEMKVQGMDYAYTIHGWLKALNSGVLDAEHDMGRDGDIADVVEYDAYEDDVHDLVARDALVFTLGYYDGDYTAITQGNSNYNSMLVGTSGSAFETDIDELFNGNITSLITGTTKTDGTAQDPLATTYHYDQLHRFKESHVFTASNIITNNNLTSATRNNGTSTTTSSGTRTLYDYEVHVDYDPNGNITDLTRMAYSSANSMDNFTYNYTSGTNKLDYVADAVTTTGGSSYGDIQNGQAADNYEYHDDGSLKADEQEEIEYIDWYPNGKIKRVYRTSASTKSDLYFEYDPMGMRSLKVEMTRTGTTIDAATEWIYTYYGCDANGITMSIYKLDKDVTTPSLMKNETMIYGGSRLGMSTEAEDVVVIDYINQCNSDGLASAVIKIPDPATAETIEIILDGVVIGTGTWSTMSSYLSNVLEIVDDLNANAVGYYANYYLESSIYYIVIKEIIAGSIEGTLTVEEDDVVTSPTWVQRQLTIGDCYAERILGDKFYELTNHLGNVMEVVADRKIAHNSSGTIDYFEADIMSYADYYPFGMEMPGRHGTSDSYRYGFNGMEKDDEASGSGNSYTTQFRQYDPRLGRWKSLDPLMHKYTSMSPYIGMGNNPNFLTDPLGLEATGDEPKKGKAKRKGIGQGHGKGKNRISRGKGKTEKERGSTKAEDKKKSTSSGDKKGGQTDDEDNNSDGFNIKTEGTIEADPDVYISCISGEEIPKPITIGTYDASNAEIVVSSNTSTMTSSFIFAGISSGADGPLLFGEVVGAAAVIGTLIYVSVTPDEGIFGTYVQPIWITPAISVPTDKTIPITVHGNSKDNPNPHIVYEIYGISPSGEYITLKFGIADKKYDTFGGSGNGRPSSQLSYYRSRYPGYVIQYRVMSETSNRAAALILEGEYVTAYFLLHGKMPPEQLRPTPFSNW